MCNKLQGTVSPTTTLNVGLSMPSIYILACIGASLDEIKNIFTIFCSLHEDIIDVLSACKDHG